MFVKEENSIKLRVRNGVIVSVILVIIEIQEIVGVVHSSESVVGKGSPATVNLHSSISTCKVIVNINNVVRELDCVTKNEHPWLSEIAYFRRFGINAGIVDNHDFFSSTDSNL